MRIADKLTFFSLSLLVFSYQSLMIVYLSSALAGQMISVVLVSVFISYAVGFLLNRAFSENRFKKEYLVVSQVLSVLVSLFLVNAIFLDMHDKIIHSSRIIDGNFSIWEQALSGLLNKVIIKVIFCLTIPFVTYGLIFGYYLKKYRNSFVSVLKIEVIAILSANIFCIFVLSLLGWENVLYILIAFAIFIEFIDNLRLKKYFKLYPLLLLASVGLFHKQLVPVSNLNISAKDFSAAHHVQLLRESWNFHSRTKTLEVQKKNENSIKTERIISLDEGTGIARIPRPNQHITTVDFVSVFQPRNILILFAGAGAEMVSLQRSFLSASLQSIDSVELNPAVISHGMLDSNGFLESVLEDSRFHLIHDDARLYLEKSTKKYDTILFSWSGATVAHYSGALMHTTQYAFTREAMQAALKRLSDDGFLIIFGASKINLITHFRELNITDLEKKIILLEAQNGQGWKNSWDDHILIFSKKSLHYDSALFAELSRVSEENQYSVVLFPEKNSSLAYQSHVDLIKEDNWTLSLEKLRKDNGIYFQSHTDDKPFVYSCCQFFSFSSELDFIASVKKLFLFSNGVNYHNCIGFILLIICAYLFLNRKNSRTQKSNWSLSFLSGFLSGFFNFFIFYKAILYLGFPNYALVLSVMTASIANYSSLIFLNKKPLNIHLLKLFLISYMPLLIYFGIMQMNYFYEILFELPSLVKIFFLASFLPAIFFNSLIYNCLFFKTIHDPHFLENVVIFDTLGGCLSVLLTPMLVNDFGMVNSLLGVSVFFFLLLWLSNQKNLKLQINKSSIF